MEKVTHGTSIRRARFLVVTRTIRPLSLRVLFLSLTLTVSSDTLARRDTLLWCIIRSHSASYDHILVAMHVNRLLLEYLRSFVFVCLIASIIAHHVFATSYMYYRDSTSRNRMRSSPSILLVCISDEIVLWVYLVCSSRDEGHVSWM